MKIDYNIRTTVCECGISSEDGGQFKGYRVDLVHIPIPGRKEQGCSRTLWVELGSTDYPHGQDAMDNVEPEHPEFDAVIQGGKNIRVRVIIEEVE